MKALGVGPRCLRLPRRRGGAGRRLGASRRWRCTGGPPRLAAERGVTAWHLSLTHTDTPGRSPSVVAVGCRPAGSVDGRMMPVLTPEEMAAIDAAAPEPVEVLIGRAGAAAWPGRRRPAGRHLRAAGGGRRRQGQQRQRRPGGRRAACARRGVRVTWSTPADAPGACPRLRPGRRRRLRHRASAARTTPPTPATPRCWPSTSPRGVDGLTGAVRAGAGRRADGHVRRAQARPAVPDRARPRRRRRGGRHRARRLSRRRGLFTLRQSGGSS